MDNCKAQEINKESRHIVRHTYFENAQKQLQNCFKSICKGNQRCIAIIGPSGSGKTTVVKDFANAHETTETETCRNNPVVLVETPSNPTVKSLASAVLKELGDQLYAKGTEVQMTSRIVDLLEETKVRVLLFDEMQNLIDRESDRLNNNTAEWLKGLINKVSVSIVVVGLERTQKLFNNDQLRRRFRNPVRMKAFNWHDPKDRKILRGFLGAMQTRYKFEDGISLTSPDLAYRFFCATNGLVAYIVAILEEAQEIASENYEPVIRMRDLAEAYVTTVCCNDSIGVNPFEINEMDRLEAAREVVMPTPAKKGKTAKKSGNRTLGERMEGNC
jgi:Cdc6-like AAA superfamily ATPase